MLLTSVINTWHTEAEFHGCIMSRAQRMKLFHQVHCIELLELKMFKRLSMQKIKYNSYIDIKCA